MSKKIWVVLGWMVLLAPVISLAKPADEQNQIILLNDAASALEDSNPALSKQLTLMANNEEKDWEQEQNSNNKNAPLKVIKNALAVQAEVNLLNQTAIEIAPTYPLIAHGLTNMIKDIYAAIYPAVNTTEDNFLKDYPLSSVRNFRHEGMDDWLTYNQPLDDPYHELVTFHFHQGSLVEWKIDDRPEVVREYLNEFSFYQPPSLTYQAIKDVLLRMPYEDFLSVTRRQRPMLFTEFYVEGTARFASSSEFLVDENNPPCCSEGFTIIKLGMSLGLAKTPVPIEGVVAHEIAHRVLDTIKKGNINCDAERASNRLIQQWGFKTEFKEAKLLFGTKKGDPVACQEVHHDK